MKITSLTDYLVSQMVKSAVGLQQQNKENMANQGVLKSPRERLLSRSLESNQAAGTSSAYRVTISSAARQKMATVGT